MDAREYEFLNDRVDHVDGRVDDLDTRITMLESAREVKKSRAMEWLVIVLILIEILQGIPLWRPLWRYVSHG